MPKRRMKVALSPPDPTVKTGSVSETIIDAIHAASLTGSVYEIAKRSGVHESILSRFLSGKQGITLNTVDKLAEALGLRLVRSEPDKSGGAIELTGRQIVNLLRLTGCNVPLDARVFTEKDDIDDETPVTVRW